jgi:hypothetical protein
LSICKESWIASVRFYMTRENLRRRPSRGNTWLILTAGRSDFWIGRNCKTVFRDNAKWNLEFWGQITGWLDFRVRKESRGYGQRDRKSVH